jgi:hypothetical protein
MTDTLCVTTRDPLEDILAANNSAAWFLQPRRARQAKYLVCAAMDRDRPDIDRKPFLVAEISDVVLDPAASKHRPRYAISFERYALVDAEKAKRLTGSQNPVRWRNLSDLISVSANQLRWQHVSPKTLPYSYSRREPREPSGIGLSIDEAKTGLAARFGVSEDAIEIIIRA